jgi:hypothetical protein
VHNSSTLVRVVAELTAAVLLPVRPVLRLWRLHTLHSYAASKLELGHVCGKLEGDAAAARQVELLQCSQVVQVQLICTT